MGLIESITLLSPWVWDDGDFSHRCCSLLQNWLVKEEKHAATIARHSSMKSSADEQEAFQQWRHAQDSATKRAKKATPLLRCAECDRHSSAP